MLKKQLLKDTLGWGIILWLIGYILGIVLFFIVQPKIIGWVILPIGLMITLWVLFKKVKSKDFLYYLILSFVWTVIAFVFDYFFIVKILKPADGYYKLDVYLYYFFTFTVPLIVWRWKNKALS